MLKDSDVKLPRWELSDPFGRAALRSMRYELKKALCERDGYKAERDEILKAKANAVDGLMDALRREQQKADENINLFYRAEDARKLVANNNRELREKLHDEEMARMLLRVELERLKEEHEKVKAEYAQLQADHERLVYLTEHPEAEI